MHYKAIIFDMDGTLVDSLFIWDVIWVALGKHFNGGQTITQHPFEAASPEITLPPHSVIRVVFTA